MGLQHWRFLGATLWFAGALPCWGHTALNPGMVLEFKVSKTGMTRISMENDAIEDVYAYPAEPDLITHHKSGHVFVTPDGMENSVYVTVITRKGTAQDLKLTPVSKKPEPILLKAEEPKPTLSPQDQYAGILGQFVQGKIPPGFYACQVEEASRGEGPVEAILDKAYRDGKLRVLVFVVTNTDSERRPLDNRAFWGAGDLASAFDRSALGSRETARLYIIQQL